MTISALPWGSLAHPATLDIQRKEGVPGVTVVATHPRVSSSQRHEVVVAEGLETRP